MQTNVPATGLPMGIRPSGAVSTQVHDDPDLLRSMMEALKRAPATYRTTNYWDVYERLFLPELSRHGLKDFRRRKRSVLSRFGATDLLPDFGRLDLRRSRLFNNRILRALPCWEGSIALLESLLGRILPISSDFYYYDLEKLHIRACEFVERQAEIGGALPLTAFEASLCGNPEDLVRYKGRNYTMPMLYYYLRYVYCCRFVDFSKIDVLVELGSGSGKQIEILKKLYPRMTVLLFDVPPQLYVCEQYLKEVFPGDVVSFRDTENWTSLAGLQAGKIHVFGSWHFPVLEGAKIDLFWNAASFQEMEPEVVVNYLKYVNSSAQKAFLQEIMAGKPVAKASGAPGVMKPTTFEDYKSALSAFDMVDLSPSMGPMNDLDESDSFWVRRGVTSARGRSPA